MNLTFSDGELVTDKPTKPKWRESNSVVDMINSGEYDSPRRVTSHVRLHVNSVNDGSPTIVVYRVPLIETRCTKVDICILLCRL